MCIELHGELVLSTWVIDTASERDEVEVKHTLRRRRVFQRFGVEPRVVSVYESEHQGNANRERGYLPLISIERYADESEPDCDRPPTDDKPAANDTLNELFGAIEIGLDKANCLCA